MRLIPLFFTDSYKKEIYLACSRNSNYFLLFYEKVETDLISYFIVNKIKNKNIR